MNSKIGQESAILTSTPVSGKKRGRPKLTATPVIEDNTNNSVHSEDDDTVGNHTPRQGRPPKTTFNLDDSYLNVSPPKEKDSMPASCSDSDNPEITDTSQVPRKRGRPPKKKDLNETVEKTPVFPINLNKELMDVSANDQTDTSIDRNAATPKRPGRPPKTVVFSSCSILSADEGQHEGGNSSVSIPKKRGRPPKAKEIVAEKGPCEAIIDENESSRSELSETLPLKKRGRPFKVKNKSSQLNASGGEMYSTEISENQDCANLTSQFELNGKEALDVLSVQREIVAEQGPSEASIDENESSRSELSETLPPKKRGRPFKVKNKSSELNASGGEICSTKISKNQDCANLTSEFELNGKETLDVFCVPKKRGRPPKVKQEPSREDMTSIDHSVESSNQSIVEEGSLPKKRGRPPKVRQSPDAEKGGDSSIPKVSRRSRGSVRKAKSYAELPSGSSDGTEIDEYEDELVISESFTDMWSQSRKRGQTPQSIGEGNDAIITPRRRGRPKKVCVDADESEEEGNDAGVKKQANETVPTDCTLVPRKRGRPKKEHVESDDEEGDANTTEKKPKKKLAEPLKCLHCDKKGENTECDTLASYRNHLLHKHQLFWNSHNPEGVEDMPRLFRLKGRARCKGCDKEFRFLSYYQFHQKWCGREDEMTTCSVCGRTVKSMYFPAHQRNHEKIERKKEEDLQVKPEEAPPLIPEGEGRAKRKSAVRALKNISYREEDEDSRRKKKRDRHDGFDEDVSDDEAAYKEDDEDDDEEEDDDDDDEEEDEYEEDFDENEKDGERLSSGRHYLYVDRAGIREGVKKATRDYLSNARENIGVALPSWTPLLEDWKALSSEEALKYLPLTSHSPQFLIQTSHPEREPDISPCMQIPSLASAFIQGSFCVFTGGPVRAMDWLPTGAEETQHVLAVYSHRDPNMTTKFDDTDRHPALLQLWSISSLTLKGDLDEASPPKFALGLAVDMGILVQIKWCPVGNSMKSSDGGLSRLGLIAMATSSGHILIYSIPDPGDVVSAEDSDGAASDVVGACRVFRSSPVRVLQQSEEESQTPCMCLDWGDSGGCAVIVAGFGDGTISVWDLKSTSTLLHFRQDTLLPHTTFNAHYMAVNDVKLFRKKNSYIVSCSIDRHMKQWDMQRPYRPIGVAFKSSMTGLVMPLHYTSYFVWSDDCYCLEHNAVQIHDNGFIDGSTKPATVHNAAVMGADFNNWFNVLASVDATGLAMINPFTTLTRVYRNYKHIPRTRRLLQTVEESHADKPQLRDSLATMAHAYSHSTLTFTEFAQDETINAKKTTKIDSLGISKDFKMVDLTVPGLVSGTKVAWNPNETAYTWLALGGAHGLIRLRWISPQLMLDLLKLRG